MSTPYPTSLDNGTTLPYPSSTDTLSSPNLASGQDNQNDSLIAIETKVGIGSSLQSPTSGFLLAGTATGTSEWSIPYPVGTIVGTTDTQTLTNKTLTSPIINSPTISSPTITGSLGNISTGTITASGLITANNGITASGTITLPANSLSDTMIATGTINKLFLTQTSGSSSGASSTPVSWNAWPGNYSFNAIVGRLYSIEVLEPQNIFSVAGPANYFVNCLINGTMLASQESNLFDLANDEYGNMSFHFWWQATASGTITVTFQFYSIGPAGTFTWARTTSFIAYLVINELI